MARRNIEKRRIGPVRVIIIIVLIAIIAYCLYQVLPYVLNNLKEKNAFDQISQEYTNVGDNRDENWWYTDVDIDVAGLQSQYPDVIGWIRFDEPEETILIDYPILYSGDDDTYLHRDMDKKSSYPGCIFLEGENNPALTDTSSIIYGHNMRNGTMFGTLKYYQDDGVYDANQYFTIYTKDMAYRYHIFSYFTTGSNSDVYMVGFEPDEIYQNYLTDLVNRSVIDTGIVPTIDQKIVLLSTCKGSGTDYRFVVCGVCEASHAYPAK